MHSQDTLDHSVSVCFCAVEGLPVVLVLDDSLVPLQLVLQRRLVHCQVAALTREPLQGPLGFLDLFPEGFDLLVVHLYFIIIALLCVLDGLFQY